MVHHDIGDVTRRSRGIVVQDELREYLRTEGSVYQQIRETGELPDDLAEKLNKEIEKFTQMFNVEEESALV